MSGDKEFSISVRLRHHYGGWRLEINGLPSREITAEEALAWAAHANEDLARQVQRLIRADADEAEAKAKDARRRAKEEVVRQAEAALEAEQRARARRAEADSLAPITALPSGPGAPGGDGGPGG